MTQARSLLIACAFLLLVFPQAKPASAHPHIFVDAQISFVLGGDRTLEALEIVWLFDPFHTLYILAFDGVTPTADGTLDAAGQTKLSKAYTEWQRGFDGFSKLSLNGAIVGLSAPRAARARLLGDQLEISFTRSVAEPIAIDGTVAEVSVYDETYYHAVTVAETPKVLGTSTQCVTTLIPFKPTDQDQEVQTMLSKLKRDEVSPIEGIGASFADRIVLSCT